MRLIKNNLKILQTDPTLQHNKMVNDIINQFKNKNLLSKEAAEELKVINPKIPKFHITPKIHKNQGNLSTVNCQISEISRFVYHHFQSPVKEILSYIKDSNDAVNKINNSKVPQNS